jgi:hypothetical protein
VAGVQHVASSSSYRRVRCLGFRLGVHTCCSGTGPLLQRWRGVPAGSVIPLTDWRCARPARRPLRSQHACGHPVDMLAATCVSPVKCMYKCAGRPTDKLLLGRHSRCSSHPRQPRKWHVGKQAKGRDDAASRQGKDTAVCEGNLRQSPTATDSNGDMHAQTHLAQTPSSGKRPTGDKQAKHATNTHRNLAAQAACWFLYNRQPHTPGTPVHTKRTKATVVVLPPQSA